MNDRVPDKLRAFRPDAVLSTTEFRGDLAIGIRAEDLVAVCQFLKNDPGLGYTMAIDITAVDYYRPEDRYEIVYHLYSPMRKTYLRLKVSVDERDLTVPSVTGVWRAADWHERETFDMFGIKFSGHPDLRRLYMPEEFEYHPLRKDFPLMGIPDSIPLPRR